MYKNIKIKSFLASSLIVFGLFLFNVSDVFAAVSLTVAPATQTVQNGQNLSVDIMLDTGADSIDGVDIFYLRYNPNILQVQDANGSVSGVQITPGSILPLTLINTANNSNGTVQFSQVNNGGSNFKGSGKLATVTFKAVGNGTSNISIDFSPGGTSDSNVAGEGGEKLSSVSGASVVVSAPVVVTPSPVASVSLSPATINSGESSTLTWSSTDATSCTASDGWTGSKATSGSLLVNPTKDTVYTLTCSGAGGTDKKSVTLSVALLDGIPAVSISVKPHSITLGQSATITWSSLNATSCTASRGWTGAQALSGSLVVSPTTNTTYSLKCVGVNGSKSASDSIKVNPVSVVVPAPVVPVYNPTPITTTNTGYTLTQTLYKGMNGAQVNTLQTILIKLGYNIGGNPTGYFGPKTDEAVKAFQSSRGIATSGVSYGLVGPNTRNALLTAVSSNTSSSIQSIATEPVKTPIPATTTTTTQPTTSSTELTQTLYRGLRSPQVTTLQNILIKLGYSVGGPATGYYGVKTEDAVKAFQRSNGIASYYGNSINTGYGIVGPATRAALLKAVAGR